MAKRASCKKRNGFRSPTASVLVGLTAVTTLVLFLGLGAVLGADAEEEQTLGIGDVRSSADLGQWSESQEASTAQGRAGNEVPQSQGTEAVASSAQLLQAPQERTFIVEDPGPGVVFAAVDTGDANTVAVAATLGTTGSLSADQRQSVDMSSGEWLVGLASGYDVASSSTLTYSGRAFDDECITVAVPQGMESYLGRPVEIVWHGKVVIATVTDTGGFAPYGRSLDLGSGVCKAFGYDSVTEWGVRTVHYRFL